MACMKQINDLSLAGLASGLSKMLSDDLGGEFEVAVQKFERTEKDAFREYIALNFVVTDRSTFRRYEESRQGREDLDIFGQPKAMTYEQFKAQAARTATPTEVTYDLRPFGQEQQEAVAVYLGQLMLRLNMGTLKPTVPVIIITDERYESTEQLDGFVAKLAEAGLTVQFEKDSSAGLETQ